MENLSDYSCAICGQRISVPDYQKTFEQEMIRAARLQAHYTGHIAIAIQLSKVI